jgi:hypothetical protein
VLKHNLKLDMPSLIVRDGVITFPAGCLEAADRAKAVKLLSEIPKVNDVKILKATSQQTADDASKSVQIAGDETVSASESILLPKGLPPSGIYSSRYWQIRAGRISQRLTAITKVKALIDEI